MSARRVKRIILQGDVTVAYRKEGSEWFATALEFDLLGYGRTRKAALKLLQELIAEYMLEVARLVSEGKRVAFFNPSETAEWNNWRFLERFHVAFVADSRTKIESRVQDHTGLGGLIEYIDSLDVELVPAWSASKARSTGR